MWDYPFTKIVPVTDIVHGVKLVDNYRWLEDSDSPVVVEWSKSQNEFTEEALERNGKLDVFKQELAGLFEFDSFGLPHFRADYYYWSERKTNANQSSIYRKKGLEGEPELLLDPTGRREDDAITITVWNVSPEGKYFVYALSESGTEMGTIFVRNLETGEELTADTIPYCRHPQVAWVKDESGFFYTHSPEPGTVPKGEEQYHTRISRHQIGRSYKKDPVIFGDGRDKTDMYGIRISDDRLTLIISAAQNWLQNEIWLYDIESETIKVVIQDIPAKFSLKIVRGKAYLWTNHEAENGRVLISDVGNLPTAIEGWSTFIAEREYKLSGTNCTADMIIAVYMKDACSLVELVDMDGNKIRDLDLPKHAAFSGLSSRYDRSEFFYGYSTFLTPYESYRYDPQTGKVEPYRSLELPFDPTEYVVSQEWYSSNDGTRVPMFLVHRKDLRKDGTNPTLLYGYGGFGTSMTPSFIRGYFPFVDRGGIYAIANIRGGGEYGTAWHKAAIVENKQISFDDFMSAAEYLISEDYTNPQKLAIMGGSNGGLLVGACMIQKPQLFKAVVCRVPLLDMVRFPMFLIASRWVNEYGDPKVEVEFERIIKWSPYHNVHEGEEYPATLFMTADHDTRVEPLHARKMAALLQSINTMNPILIRTEIEAGHGSGTPLDKWLSSQAVVLTFLAWQLDMIEAIK